MCIYWVYKNNYNFAYVHIFFFFANINHKKVRSHAILAYNSVVKYIKDKLTHYYNRQQEYYIVHVLFLLKIRAIFL
jgi:hypothetical protein